MRNLSQIVIVLLFTGGADCDIGFLWQNPMRKEDGRRPGGGQGLTPNQLVPGNYAGVSNKRAASLVKERYSSSRILGVSLLDDKGPPVYRVRTLSSEGCGQICFCRR